MGSGEYVHDEQEHRAAGITESSDFPSVSLFAGLRFRRMAMSLPVSDPRS